MLNEKLAGLRFEIWDSHLKGPIHGGPLTLEEAHRYAIANHLRGCAWIIDTNVAREIRIKNEVASGNCSHKRLRYTGTMPCTGSRVCRDCGITVED